MDGKDKIIEKILSDADNYRESVTLKAKENAEKVVSDAEEEATRIISEALDFLKKEEEETLKRRKTLAVLDGKKLYLSGKSRAVEKVFSTCLYKLNRLDKSTYKSIICRLIKENAKNGDTIVLAKNSVLNAKDVLSAEEVKKLNLNVKEGGNFNGGIVIEGKSSDLNLSFEAIVSDLKERYETYVSEKLFD